MKYGHKLCIYLVIFLAVFFIPTTVLAAADPIAHFKFDDGSGTEPDDSSTNNIPAAFTPTNPTWSSDVPSAITFDDPYSLDFTGNGDGVTVTWPTELNFADTDPRSFSFWYKPIANGEGQYSRLISWSNDRLEIAGTSAGGTNHRIAYFDGDWHDTDITLSLGTWYHVIFTYDGTTAKFYINNELQDEHSLAGRSLSGTMRIGNRVQQLDEGINGRMDDVRIYDYALNTTQISNIASGSNNPDGDPTPTPTPSPSPTNSSSSNNSSTSSNVPYSTSCDKSAPSTYPHLFQVTTSLDSATLYFTPVLSANRYVISYGLNNTADQHSVLFDQKDNSGVISHTIGALTKNTKYYFKVRGMNGCAPGNWSSILSEKTNTSNNVAAIKTQPIQDKVMTFSQINGAETEVKIESPVDKEKIDLDISTSTDTKSTWNYQYITIIFGLICLFLSLFLIFFGTKEKKTKNSY